MRTSDRIKVEQYSYLIRFVHFVIYLIPPILRTPFWKIIFAKYGKNVMIGEKSYFHYPWKIQIGDGADIGKGFEAYPSYQYKEAIISIGKNVLIAPNCTIFGAGHPTDNAVANAHVAESVILEDDTYIGGNVTIRYGVVIGRNSIVAAGSVVVKNVEPFTIVGGNPAKQIGIVNK